MKYEKYILSVIGIFSICTCLIFLLLIQQSLARVENLIVKKQMTIEKPIDVGQRIEIVVLAKISAYTPEQKYTDSTPYITAFNVPVRTGIIAISKSLEKDFNLKHGDEIIIPSVGRYIIADRMNQTKWKDYRVDIFMWCPKQCRKFGVMDTPIILVKKNI